MHTEKVDVLIAGAGPAGMTLATALQRQGVRFRVVDRDSGPTEATRVARNWCSRAVGDISGAMALLNLQQSFNPPYLPMKTSSVLFSVTGRASRS